mmetsp:Transcript_4311/g.13232  ORF Transcript_4311/g.13232 Transcript_4311/m.13232 type:complete len:114 (-) Transcript_4311:77-418(-)
MPRHQSRSFQRDNPSPHRDGTTEEASSSSKDHQDEEENGNETSVSFFFLVSLSLSLSLPLSLGASLFVAAARERGCFPLPTKGLFLTEAQRAELCVVLSKRERNENMGTNERV